MKALLMVLWGAFVWFMFGLFGLGAVGYAFAVLILVVYVPLVVEE